jgi:hypothetical protein
VGGVGEATRLQIRLRQRRSPRARSGSCRPRESPELQSYECALLRAGAGSVPGLEGLHVRVGKPGREGRLRGRCRADTRRAAARIEAQRHGGVRAVEVRAAAGSKRGPRPENVDRRGVIRVGIGGRTARAPRGSRLYGNESPRRGEVPRAKAAPRPPPRAPPPSAARRPRGPRTPARTCRRGGRSG